MLGTKCLKLILLLGGLAFLSACNQTADPSFDKIAASTAAQNDQSDPTIPLGMDFSPSDSKMVFVHGASPVTVIDLTGREAPRKLSIDFPPVPNRTLSSYINGQWLQTPRVHFTDEERIMVAASEAVEEGTLPVWKVQFTEWDIVNDRELSSREFDNVINWCFSRDSSRVALLVKPADKPVHILLWESDKEPIKIPFPSMQDLFVPKMALSADGSILSLSAITAFGRFEIEPDGKLRLVSEKRTHVHAVDDGSENWLETAYDGQPNRFPNTITPNLRIIRNDRVDTVVVDSSADEPKSWCHFFAEGRFVAAALGEAVHVWHAVDGRHVAEFKIAWRKVVGLRGSRAGDYVAIAMPKEIVVWNPHDGTVKKYLVGK